jgi:biotin carboxylase
MLKKILLLGGSHGQLPAINEAKKRGLHTILCDYLPDNPGRALVDQYYEVSTTDKRAVLDIAKKHEVDAVLAYASDPATITQAYVSDRLGLIGNSEQSVYILSNKSVFRNFQRENNFSIPDFQTFTFDQLSELNDFGLDFPVVVKPVDSSDTKGVYKVETIGKLKEKAEIALSFSRVKKIIVEEFINGDSSRLHGDAFFLDGEMVFSMLGDQFLHSDVSPLKPSATFFPSRLPQSVITKVEEEVAAITRLSGFKNGPVNVEARVDKNGKVYVMEIGPRSGGSLIPQAINYSCGFDMLKSTFDLLLNVPVKIQNNLRIPAICYSMHTNKGGVFRKFRMNGHLKPFVKETHVYVQPGDTVKPYSEPGSTIGILLLTFPDFDVANLHLEKLYQTVQDSVILA